jgi:hypothetical protein
MTEKLVVQEVDGALRPWTYEGTFERLTANGVLRLVIGPESAPVELMWTLMSTLPPPYFLLYVLLKDRGEAVPGRYQSPPLDASEARSFLSRYQAFFEGDGRHHVWLATDGRGHVVYDQHDVLYAYGPLEHFEDVLTRSGLQPGDVRFPGEHAHAYHRAYDAVQRDMLLEYDWRQTALRSEDIWD